MKKLYVILFFSLLINELLIAQSSERKVLLALGMENISVVNKGEECYIAYENNIYREVSVGVANVIKELRALPDTKSIYHLVVLNHNVPKVCVTFPRDIQSIRVSYDTDQIMHLLKDVKPSETSAGKVDLVIYPQLFLRNHWLDRIYGTAFNLAPALEIDLWKGASFRGQAIFPLWTNMTDEKKYIRAGLITLRQEVHLPHTIDAALTIGNFTNMRMGMHIETSYHTPNGRWATGADAGLTGGSTFYLGKWEVYPWNRLSGRVWGRYYEPYYGLTFDAQALRNVYEDMGGRIDCRRKFGTLTIGFYAEYTGSLANGGFHFTIPIMPTKHVMKRHAFRVSLPEHFQREYVARWNMDIKKGYSYNIRYQTTTELEWSEGYYNPIYLRKEILKEFANIIN